MVVYCDNSSVIDTSKNPVQHSKMKHTEIIYHFIRDLVERKIVSLEYIPTKRQNADTFTKPLDRSKFEILHQVIGVILCPWSSLAFKVLVLHRFTLCDHCSLLSLFFYDLHSITFMHFILDYFCYFFSKIYIYIYKKKKERKGKQNVFCIIFLGFEFKVGQFIFT